MRRIAIQVLTCLLCMVFSASAAEKKPVETKKVALVRAPVPTPPYWFRYPQFTDADVRLVVNWFQDALEAKRLHLAAIPAAVAREIHITARLTGDVVKSLVMPPSDLEGKLLPLPEGYQRLLAGSVLLIVKTDERLVVDTLPFAGR